MNKIKILNSEFRIEFKIALSINVEICIEIKLHIHDILQFSGHDSSPGQKRPQPSRDPAPPHQREQTVPKSGHSFHQQGRDPHEKSKKSAEIEPQSFGQWMHCYFTLKHAWNKSSLQYSFIHL